MIRDYVKINEQDLKLAEDFFENDKHFNEWLVNVVRYYRGKNVEIKTKIVQKYFNNYKKTMDFILFAVKKGKEGVNVKAEKQLVKTETLQRVLEPTLIDTLEVNSKVINSKDKYTEFIKWFNKTTNRNFKGEKKSQAAFNSRISEGYMFEDFKKAIEAIKQDSFHKENNFKWLTPTFITRAEQLEKWSNFKIEKVYTSQLPNAIV